MQLFTNYNDPHVGIVGVNGTVMQTVKLNVSCTRMMNRYQSSATAVVVARLMCTVLSTQMHFKAGNFV